MKKLFALFAAVLLIPAVSHASPLGVIYDDKIWTFEEISAYPDVTVQRPSTFPPGTIWTLGTPTWGVPSRISMIGDNGIEGYVITNGAKGRWVLVPVGDGTFKSLDFDAPAPGPDVLTVIGAGGETLAIPTGNIVYHGSTGPQLATTAVPEPGTIGLLLGGASVLALIARRKR